MRPRIPFATWLGLDGDSGRVASSTTWPTWRRPGGLSWTSCCSSTAIRLTSEFACVVSVETMAGSSSLWIRLLSFRSRSFRGSICSRIDSLEAVMSSTISWRR